MVLSAYNFLVVALSTAAFSVLYRVISPRISIKWFRRFWKLSRREKIEWNERILSSFHAFVASVISTAVLITDQGMHADPVWGVSTVGKSLLGFTLSYMAVDMVIMMSYFKLSADIVYFFHHIAAVFAYYVAIEANFSIWFGLVRLTAEWSTIFVNSRWHMQVIGAKDSKFYMLNGLIMALTFFLCRIVPMPYFWYQVYSYYQFMPLLGLYTIIFSCIVLDALNLFWMYKLTLGLFKVIGKTQVLCRIRHTLSRVVDDLNTLFVM